MPWQKVTIMSSKLEFIRFALQESEPFVSLCKRFNISTKTGYKLLNNYLAYGEEALTEKSRRPITSPNKTCKSIEKLILDVRVKKPTWGGRKIRAFLKNQGKRNLPATSTITDILHRHNLIERKDRPEKAFERFEHESPNDLWQVDFKGHFAMHKGRCHPLTILDDHSRFSIGLYACKRECASEVKSHFIDVFEEYGLPYRINFDNGSPWASITSRLNRFTELSLWLIRLGVSVSYSRVRRPQTNGKLERFHRTLKDELLQFKCFFGINEAQRYFNQWRDEYNLERPHDSVGMKPPISRYHPSKRKYPEALPDIIYRDTDVVRTVDVSGKISIHNKKIFISAGLVRLPVALRELKNGKFDVFFCSQKIVTIDLNKS